MTQEINIACSGDLEELTQLLHLLFTQDIEFEPNYQKQKEGLEQIIANPGLGEILVSKVDGKTIGMASLLYSISTVLGGKVAILEDMIIDKDFRSKGFGRELLKEAIDFAKRRNCLRLSLLTDFDNDAAINLYKSVGFNVSKMIPLRLVFA
jgi:GNAT superfamily N-acetyltransferase